MWVENAKRDHLDFVQKMRDRGVDGGRAARPAGRAGRDPRREAVDPRPAGGAGSGRPAAPRRSRTPRRRPRNSTSRRSRRSSRRSSASRRCWRGGRTASSSNRRAATSSSSCAATSRPGPHLHQRERRYRHRQHLHASRAPDRRGDGLQVLRPQDHARLRTGHDVAARRLKIKPTKGISAPIAA